MMAAATAVRWVELLALLKAAEKADLLDNWMAVKRVDALEGKKVALTDTLMAEHSAVPSERSWTVTKNSKFKLYRQ